MDDLISRQAAIDALKEIPDYNDGMVFEALSHALRDIELLPSAQPTYTDEQIQKMQGLEQAQLDKAYECGKRDAVQWIPCSERLPEPYVRVLTSDNYGHLDIARLEETWVGTKEELMWWLNDGGNLDVKAWMPLPES